MSTTPHPDPDPSDRTEPLTQPIGTTPGGTKDADERREPRVATIVWGLILVAVAAGVLAVAQGYRIDAELALIVGLGVAGLLLLVGSLATAARRRRRSSGLPR